MLFSLCVLEKHVFGKEIRVRKDKPEYYVIVFTFERKRRSPKTKNKKKTALMLFIDRVKGFNFESGKN